MLHSKKLALLFITFFSLAFAEFASADMLTTQSGSVVTITDIGSNPNSSFTVAINRNHALVVETSNDNYSGTITRAFDASKIRQIRIFTGSGNDRVILKTSISVSGQTIVQSRPDIDVQIQTGAGNDNIFVVGADLGNVSIQSGIGDDLVRLSADSVVNEDLSILTLAGNDDVSLNTIDVYGNTTVTTGSGSDKFETYRSLFTGMVNVDTGPSMDQISIGGPATFSYRQNHFLGPLYILGGTGNDLVNVDNGDYGFVRIDGGTGLDCYVPYGSYRFDTSIRLFNINTCQPDFPYSSQVVYKTVDGQDLELIVIKPENWEPEDNRPAILFFHGGAWISGTPLQLIEQANYFANRGLVCVLVQYRLLDREIRDEAPVVCINDAKSAMRFLRSNSGLLGIDPNRIATSGASAGGHLAAFLGTTDGMDDPQDDLSVSARADAMCLFCPVYNNGPGNFGFVRVGNEYPLFSPMHNITPDDAPHIVLVGSEDEVVPAETVTNFRRAMLDAGVASDLRIYAGGTHSFFLRRFDDANYRNSLAAMHRFLNGLGWIDGPPVYADF